jgi:UDP-3-O-[3-hydroxymyristoyl] glucosamine N-acyltransferase
LCSDGFGFAPHPDGSYQKVSQIGNVVIEDDVEIGSNTTIDRATMGSTIIGKGVKMDNLYRLPIM